MIRRCSTTPQTSQYVLEKSLKPAENQRVFKLLQDYVNSHYSFKNTNNRDLRKYLERQYYTKKAGISTGEEEDPVEEYIRKRKAAKVTRRSAISAT
ncbi:hypothetical protein G6F64_014327 [Rhizopus arrhizus]|uniref:Uncharacterized protein n=1 Tax=Rhizopus oryzae TaxID=64495 RepID=A0A9P7BJP5_RHIOR|nr:hypothetical protein G6F64_014327 [Rhizopus arrhizus]